MPNDDSCHALDGFRFWTNTAGYIHVTETPDSAGPLDQPYILRMPNQGNVELPLSTVYDYAEVLIKTGRMRDLIHPHLYGKAPDQA